MPGTLQELLMQKTSEVHPQSCVQCQDRCQDGVRDMVEQSLKVYFLNDKK